jgi:hypothetical protein
MRDVDDRWKIYLPGKGLSRAGWHGLEPAPSTSPIQTLLDRLRAAGWVAPPPAPEETVGEVEDSIGVPFPPDYRAFLLAAGGDPRESAWRGLWSLEQVRSLNRSMPIFQWFGGLVGIGNEGFVVYALDYRGEGSPPVVSLGLSASDPAEIEIEAASFSDWLEGTLPRP